MASSSFLTDLKGSLQSSAVAYDAIIRVAKSSEDVHIFVEGPDDTQFYSYQIQRIFHDEKVVSYICGSKNDVIETNRKIRASKYVTFPKKMLYFVDRDLDTFISKEIDSSIFVTSFYSFESYFLNENLIMRMIDSEITCHDALIQSDTLGEAYTTAIQLLSEGMKEFFAKAIILKQLYAKNREKYHEICSKKIEFKTLNISSKINFSDEMDLELAPDFISYIHSKTNIPEIISDDDILSEVQIMIDVLSRKDFKFYLRGKYGVEFTLVWIKSLVNLLKRKYGSGAVFSRAPEGHDIFKVYAAPRISPPPELIDYIATRI